MTAFIELPWWLGALGVLVLTAPAGAAGAALLGVWRARRARDALGWCLLGYALASGLSLVLARTLFGGWGRARAVEGGELWWTSVVVAVGLCALLVVAMRRRRGA